VDERRALLDAWLTQLAPRLGLDPTSLRPASSDASFRRYFRLDTDAPTALSTAGAVDGSLGTTLIVMDAPPPHENCQPYVHIAGLLAARGVNTPQIVASDLDRGFLLLTDFGNTTYADALQVAPADTELLYADALSTLVRLQTTPAGTTDGACDLAAYDRNRLLTEMRLFPDWYLARHLSLVLDARERATLEAVFEKLVDAALAQSQVLVHRDYHCRNLMRIATQRAQSTDGTASVEPRWGNPGVLDFQDAVLGPITYDLVSLLRDAYIEWPEHRQIDWAARYWELARAAGLPVPERFDVFWHDLEWMGLQRSLKVLGIFARLYYRDGKNRYLGDLPVVLRHTQRVVERYDAFGGLARLLDRVHQRRPQTGFTF
jgi:aminoglycoside/choline kinase family phosphotransferase